MNGRPSVVYQSLLSLGLLVFASVASHASAALIDAAVKASTDGATIRAVIVPFIQQQVANLQKDDPAAQSAARDALAAEAGGGNQKGPSVFYLDSYADELNKQLLPVMKNPNWRVRLSAAITAARVAQAAQTSRLADVASAALDDQSDAVVVCGLEIARYTIPSIASNPGAKDSLMPKVVALVTKRPTATFTQYGYNALSLDLIEMAKVRPWTPQQWTTALSHVIPGIQEIFRKRLDEYANGVPDDPQQERRAALILTHQLAWAAQALHPPEQQVTLQLLVDLMSFASQRAVTAKDNQTRDQLIELVSYTASAIGVTGDPQLTAAVSPLERFPRGTPAETVAQSVQAAIQAIRTNQPGVKAPPAVRAVAVEIKPKTGPSTEQSILPQSSTKPVMSSPIGPTTLPAGTGGAAPRTTPTTPPPGSHPTNAPKTGAGGAGHADASRAGFFRSPDPLG